MTEELKNCPFCGGEAYARFDTGGKTLQGYASVECKKCGAVPYVHKVYEGSATKHTSDRMERMKEAAQEMYNFVKIVYVLLTEDDDSGERTMNWHFAADVARQLLDRIDGKE